MNLIQRLFRQTDLQKAFVPASSDVKRLRRAHTVEELIKPDCHNRQAATLAMLMDGPVTSMMIVSQVRSVSPSKCLSEIRAVLAGQGVTLKSGWYRLENGKRLKTYWISAEDKRKLKAR